MNLWLAGIIGGAIGAVSGAAVAWAMAMSRRARLEAHRLEAESRASAADDRATQVQADLTSQLDQRQEEISDLRTRREQAEIRAAELQERLHAQTQRFDSQQKLLDEREARFKDAFKAIGAEALQANTAQFLELANKRFETLLAQSKGDIDKKQQAIDSIVKPIRELLDKQQFTLTEIEKKREVAYRGVEEQIKHIAASHEKLNSETTKLVTALRRPEQRGRWGELQLRNAVELAGMTPHCDFVEQAHTTSADGSAQRPDMIVRLPGDGVIVVDAKVALAAYLDALQPDADRAAAMQRHADHVQKHVRDLTRKQYWNQFERTPKVVVMFVPLESAFSAALEIYPDLHTDAMKNNVLIATPTLFVALLRAIAFGWQQEDVAANAREISTVGRELYDRLATFTGHLTNVGKSLAKSVEHYNKSVGSLERSVLPSSRKLRALHVTTDDATTAPELIDTEARAVTAAELKPLPADDETDQARELPSGSTVDDSTHR
ncbi:MAG: DNA recombination protein RmuC [Planctomycetota bacterium]